MVRCLGFGRARGSAGRGAGAVSWDGEGDVEMWEGDYDDRGDDDGGVRVGCGVEPVRVRAGHEGDEEGVEGGREKSVYMRPGRFGVLGGGGSGRCWGGGRLSWFRLVRYWRCGSSYARDTHITHNNETPYNT